MKNWLNSGGWRRTLKHWFPHLPLALGLALAGLLVMALAYGRHFGVRWSDPLSHVPPSGVPFLLIGVGLLLMSIGLALRSRFAWSIALLLALATLLAVRLLPHAPAPLVANYVILLFVALLLARRAFNRSSVAAGTLFAITSSFLLLIYAVFGALYLGAEFTRPSTTR